jgi:F-type H+-transporting ATPase subunit alpha
LAAFAQFGSDLDAATQRQLDRGRRMQEMLKQPQYQPLALDQMVVSLWAVSNGYLDQTPITAVKAWETDAHAYLAANNPEIGQSILRTDDLTDETAEALGLALTDFNSTWVSPEDA